MSERSSQLLPIELWVIVFRWATYPPGGYPTPHYEPFRAASETFEEPLRTKRALVQVCRLWRSLATSFLYEDVRVRHGSEHLKIVLANCQQNDDDSAFRSHSLGRFVHRLELPFTQTETDSSHSKGRSDIHNAIEILRNCPSLKTLVRPPEASLYSTQYGFRAEIVSLSSLTRLEWWHHQHAARSGGINSLMDVLRNAPSLQFLCLGGDLGMSLAHLESPVYLPALKTLHLRRVNASFVWYINHWELPSLVHVVTDFTLPPSELRELWLRFGGQLCTVELGRNRGFHATDQISVFMRRCTAVKVLNYFIDFTAPPTEPLLEERASLECVGIYASPCRVPNDNWDHLNRHFKFLSSHLLPALKRIILYGDWQEIIYDARISPALDRLAQKGCAILFADNLTSPPCDHH